NEAYYHCGITMVICFGGPFENPIVLIVLVRVGLVSIEQLKGARPYAIVGAFVIAAVVTPPDVLSQLMLAIPMCVLYEAGLFFARFVSARRPSPAAEPAGSPQPPLPLAQPHRTLGPPSHPKGDRHAAPVP